jgi:hypothetical protein
MKPKKQIKNIAAQAFPSQFERLRPESGKAGGVKARSGTEARRMAVYVGIAEMYKQARPCCACRLPMCETDASDVHHKLGREGLLLFDVRHWLPVCRPCHDWIHAHPEEAKRLGLLGGDL